MCSTVDIVSHIFNQFLFSETFTTAHSYDMNFFIHSTFYSLKEEVEAVDGYLYQIRDQPATQLTVSCELYFNSSRRECHLIWTLICIFNLKIVKVKIRVNTHLYIIWVIIAAELLITYVWIENFILLVVESHSIIYNFQFLLLSVVKSNPKLSFPLSVPEELGSGVLSSILTSRRLGPDNLHWEKVKPTTWILSSRNP